MFSHMIHNNIFYLFLIFEIYTFLVFMRLRCARKTCAHARARARRDGCASARALQNRCVVRRGLQLQSSMHVNFFNMFLQKGHRVACGALQKSYIFGDWAAPLPKISVSACKVVDQSFLDDFVVEHRALWKNYGSYENVSKNQARRDCSTTAQRSSATKLVFCVPVDAADDFASARLGQGARAYPDEFEEHGLGFEQVRARELHVLPSAARQKARRQDAAAGGQGGWVAVGQAPGAHGRNCRRS